MNLKKESLWDNKQKNSVSKRLGKMVSHTARRRGLNTSYFSAHYTLFFFLEILPFNNKSSSKIYKFNISDINYTHCEQVSYHEKAIHLQFDSETSFLWQESIINKHANWCRDEAYNRLKDAAGSKLPVKEWLIVAR